MLYHREFIISACHFNGAEIYDAYRKLCETHSGTQEFAAARVLMLASKVLEGIHGHNFKITVEIENFFVPKMDYVVDDVVIANVVNQWDNTNLSVHPDFRGIRATTENMAHLLMKKVCKLLVPDVDQGQSDDGFIGPTITVVVHETDQIFAAASIDLADLVRTPENEIDESLAS